MNTRFMPNNLPYLPGNVYADPTVTRYHKTQLLGVKDGAITGKSHIWARRPFENHGYLTIYVLFREDD